MRKIIGLLVVSLVLTLMVTPEPAPAYRGHGGYYGPGGFWPGLVIGGILGWGFAPRVYYPPSYYYPPPSYYPPPPTYYYPPAPPPDYYYPPSAEGSQTAPPTTQEMGARMFIYPRQGQSEEQQNKDFEACHNWAVGQTGFDPAKPPAGAPDTQALQKSSDYLRAISACLDARGYTLR